MNIREPLPARRRSETLRIEVDAQVFHVTVGYYAGGRRPGEIFITSPKGSQTFAAIQAADSAVAASLALQHGCPIEVLRGAFLRTAQGGPAGVLAAALDAIADLETLELLT